MQTYINPEGINIFRCVIYEEVDKLKGLLYTLHYHIGNLVHDLFCYGHFFMVAIK